MKVQTLGGLFLVPFFQQHLDLISIFIQFKSWLFQERDTRLIIDRSSRIKCSSGCKTWSRCVVDSFVKLEIDKFFQSVSRNGNFTFLVWSMYRTNLHVTKNRARFEKFKQTFLKFLSIFEMLRLSMAVCSWRSFNFASAFLEISFRTLSQIRFFWTTGTIEFWSFSKS